MKLENLTISKNSKISQKETYKENLDKYNAHWESILIHIIFTITVHQHK